MKTVFSIKLLLGVLMGILAANALADRKSMSFNKEWRFYKGDPSQAAANDFDDSAWEAVRLPHDGAITGPFNPDEHGFSGKLPWKGVGWYRKTFTPDSADRGKRIYLDFDGAMAFPEIFINGKSAGGWDFGYVSFRVDATDHVVFGRPNVIAVKVDTNKQGTRWYPGAGIYRKVTMTVCDPVHLGHWSTFVTTPEMTPEKAAVAVAASIENHTGIPSKARYTITIMDPKGKTAASASGLLTLNAGGQNTLEQKLEISNPAMWDIADPKLYALKLSIEKDGTVLDSEIHSFGIRRFEFTADDGFHLNGRRVQLYGVNLHHDHGALGAVFNRRAMERQLEIMRDMGVNAIRTSHNPPAPELLDLCDRMGFVVWDECFDKWDDKAGRHDHQPPLKEYGQKQIRNTVMRDRNHPSVVVWSIGNELPNSSDDQKGKDGPMVTMMRDFVLQYDTTRPVGMADCIPNTASQPILDSLDLVGWNYARRYSIYRERYPDKPIIYSESASALSTRGFYELPLPITKTDYSDQLQVDSYDLNAAPWSDIPDVEFDLMEKDRFVAGEMVWTGFDYIGEPTPFDKEARSSYFGIVDLCGIPKDRFYLYRSYWRPQEKTIHILPHWNWPDRAGQNVPVFVYTNGDAAELFLNGKSLGKRVKGEYPPKPVNLAEGKPVTASSVQSDQHAAAMTVDADRQTRWCAKDAGKGQWLQIDLLDVQAVKFIGLEFEKEVKNYGYEISVSENASDWKTIAVKATSNVPEWSGPRDIFHEVDAKARYVKILFNDLKDGAWASVCSIGLYSQKIESDYYTPTYKYRLRWNDVVYQPGQLKAVAYKDGKKIGQAVMCTAGQPDQLRLTPDRNKLEASGDDLSYILVEALDKDGHLCPLAENSVKFTIEGPAQIAGVDNGNPLSLEPFQADTRKLFYGKAMLIVRTQEGKPGKIKITAGSDGLEEATASLKSK